MGSFLGSWGAARPRSCWRPCSAAPAGTRAATVPRSRPTRWPSAWPPLSAPRKRPAAETGGRDPDGGDQRRRPDRGADARAATATCVRTRDLTARARRCRRAAARAGHDRVQRGPADDRSGHRRAPAPPRTRAPPAPSWPVTTAPTCRRRSKTRSARCCSSATSRRRALRHDAECTAGGYCLSQGTGQQVTSIAGERHAGDLLPVPGHGRPLQHDRRLPAAASPAARRPSPASSRRGRRPGQATRSRRASALAQHGDAVAEDLLDAGQQIVAGGDLVVVAQRPGRSRCAWGSPCAARPCRRRRACAAASPARAAASSLTRSALSLMSSSELFSARTRASSLASRKRSRSRAVSPSPNGVSTVPVTSSGSSLRQDVAVLLDLLRVDDELDLAGVILEREEGVLPGAALHRPLLVDGDHAGQDHLGALALLGAVGGGGVGEAADLAERSGRAGGR